MKLFVVVVQLASEQDKLQELVLAQQILEDQEEDDRQCKVTSMMARKMIWPQLYIIDDSRFKINFISIIAKFW